MHILIVEDEPVIAQRLQRQISEILGNKLGRLNILHNLDDARDYIAGQSIDLLVLDLNLHGESGFELLMTFTAASFHTIIVSACMDEAIRAFEFGVLDFVAKPFTRERLEQAFNRLLDANLRQDYGVRYLSVKQAGAINLLEVSRIDYIEAAGHYSEVVIGGEIRLHDKSIDKLLAILPPSFERIHRSYIVNMNKVLRLITEPGSKYHLELTDGRTLPIGRSRFKLIKSRFHIS